jgi:long-subunit acyl-CoA synthetase (AMP-forming)
VFLLEDDAGKKHSIWELVGDEEYEPVVLNGNEAKDQVLLICFSSGTTGTPKGVNTTHFNTTSMVKQLVSVNKHYWTPQQIYCCTSPFVSFSSPHQYVSTQAFCQCITSMQHWRTSTLRLALVSPPWCCPASNWIYICPRYRSIVSL